MSFLRHKKKKNVVPFNFDYHVKYRNNKSIGKQKKAHKLTRSHLELKHRLFGYIFGVHLKTKKKETIENNKINYSLRKILKEEYLSLTWKELIPNSD